MGDELDQLPGERAGGGIQHRPRAGATRCPYCHEACEASGAVCACAECLSRHHEGCWAEGSGCSSCRSTALLRRELERVDRDDPGYGVAIDAWLKLGLVYNGGLTALSALLLNVRLLDVNVLVDLVAGAFLANLCLLLGPAIELAARRLGYRGKALRLGLFVVGFSFALLLATLELVIR